MNHPRVTLLFLPTYGPRANPIERAFGNVHDLCTRNDTRKRLPDLVAAVEAHPLLLKEDLLLNSVPKGTG